MENNIKQRTQRQNKALHTYFQLLADTLNEAGLDMKIVLKPNIAISWNKQTVKDYLWRPIQEAYIKEHSTTKLSTKDITEIYEFITRHLGEKFGVFVEFPSAEDITNL